MGLPPLPATKQGRNMTDESTTNKLIAQLLDTVEAHTQKLENLQRQIDALAEAIRNSLLALEIVASKIRKNA